MKHLAALTLIACAFGAHAASETVNINMVTAMGVGKDIGTIQIDETPQGLLFTPDLSGLRRGLHGFHVFDNNTCAPGGKNVPAPSAVSQDVRQVDPNGRGVVIVTPPVPGSAAAPVAVESRGQPGDLPLLTIDADGNARIPVVATQLKTLADIAHKTLIIHSVGPGATGAPGEPAVSHELRYACGVIP